MTDDTNSQDPIVIAPMLTTASFWIHAVGSVAMIAGLSLSAANIQLIAQYCADSVALFCLIYGQYVHRAHIVKVATTANATINSANATISALINSPASKGT